jgi:hypothetical protein
MWSGFSMVKTEPWQLLQTEHVEEEEEDPFLERWAFFITKIFE